MSDHSCPTKSEAPPHRDVAITSALRFRRLTEKRLRASRTGAAAKDCIKTIFIGMHFLRMQGTRGWLTRRTSLTALRARRSTRNAATSTHVVRWSKYAPIRLVAGYAYTPGSWNTSPCLSTQFDRPFPRPATAWFSPRATAFQFWPPDSIETAPAYDPLL